MKNKLLRVHIGLRTIKTTVAVIIAMIVIEALGTTDSKLVFAMLGAMSAVQPTFKESLESCLSQIIGVIFGALCGILLLLLKLPALVSIAIGIILVITLYNILQIHYSPSLPCLILVTLCTTPDVSPLIYATGRIWDTAIGLANGMCINMLVFPYDNSKVIRNTAKALNTELLFFLEDLYDGDDIYPDTKLMRTKIAALDDQLRVFSNQKLVLRLKRQNRELEIFKEYENKVRLLVEQMDVLCAMGSPGRLNEENYALLIECGVSVADRCVANIQTDKDIVTNYHISQILSIRQELLDVLEKK